MKFSIVTQPTLEPVSLAEFKDHARVDSADSDGLLAGYIMAARQWAESICGLALMTQTIDAYFDGFDCDLILPRGPAQSVTSVSYVDTAGATQTVSSSEYLLNSRDRVNDIRLLPGYSWPQTRDQANSVTVRYVAGFGALQSAVPEPIRHAILFYSRHLYDMNDADRGAAEALMAPYRVWF
jgi:uncharacterized phiE125 gp8 family phage protein